MIIFISYLSTNVLSFKDSEELQFPSSQVYFKVHNILTIFKYSSVCLSIYHGSVYLSVCLEDKVII